MPIRIAANTLVSMHEPDNFVAIYTGFCEAAMHDARLLPKFAIQRIVEAHGAWMNDLSRVENHEPALNDGLDHFKQCGHLAFWIRRMSPVVDATDLTKNIGDAEGYPVGEAEKNYRELLFAYGNEYLAFDFGYQICKFHEISKYGGSDRAASIVPSIDYYQTMCHFLKYKTVSPHAIFLIYKSLFL